MNVGIPNYPIASIRGNDIDYQQICDCSIQCPYIKLEITADLIILKVQVHKLTQLYVTHKILISGQLLYTHFNDVRMS